MSTMVVDQAEGVLDPGTNYTPDEIAALFAHRHKDETATIREIYSIISQRKLGLASTPTEVDLSSLGVTYLSVTEFLANKSNLGQLVVPAEWKHGNMPRSFFTGYYYAPDNWGSNQSEDFYSPPEPETPYTPTDLVELIPWADSPSSDTALSRWCDMVRQGRLILVDPTAVVDLTTLGLTGGRFLADPTSLSISGEAFITFLRLHGGDDWSSR